MPLSACCTRRARMLPCDFVRIACCRIRQACGAFSATVDAQPRLCAEYTAQEKRRLMHLVNYRPEGPLRDVAVEVQIPQGRKVRSVRLVSPGRNDLPAIAPKVAGGHV